ncbi:hypothetical protein [Rathayibacter toxicus]|uniref:Uncharacterized protein n=1 Tax=Rathayibacter toxicus TaxID=145458 RepID=A0A2S5Y6B6_9MICO|nr:hypothetical protein [Rathayibacter toxicus]ALS57838.1 hypothetical protein APU90_08685 [Rathayibacter toxicus]PPG20492.1 hypothetical protein C5D15_08240 [Rathayibacter toxicus]PPG45594.1 hypothetical protein C5D16_08210 [Rathayibacter toxicus]PPH22692.1 hypothetical protein C5D17_08250 [Rathayibacter toxicus]PPH56896.1 hypothetical protein C5D30_08240 [Rathayibacter toxicus]
MSVHLVGGGRTPAYRDALEACFPRLRDLVVSGVPHVGHSAGAAIAADRASVGGYRRGGVAVSPEAASEHLDEVTVLSIGTGALRVAGVGSVWRVSASDSGVMVSTLAES